MDRIGRQRQAEIGPALVQYGDAIDEVAAAAALQILDRDVQLVDARGNREIDERIAAAGAVLAGGELAPLLVADGEDGRSGVTVSAKMSSSPAAESTPLTAAGASGRI
jgi:hypothetical protein